MDEPVSNYMSADDKTVILDYLIILAKHSRMIFFSSAVVTVLVYLILFTLPNKYTATIRLLPPSQNMTISGQLIENLGGSSPLSMGGAMGMGEAAGLLGLKSPSAIYVAMMLGDTISRRIIDKFNLREIYEVKYFEEARKSLQSKTRITEGSKDGVVTVEVVDTDPQRAAAMANAFGEELDRLLGQITRTDAQNYLTFLEQERDQVNSNCTKAEESLRAFCVKSGVLSIDAQAMGVIQHIAELRGLIDAKEVQMQVLRQQATPANYDVITLQEELKTLKEKLRSAEAKQGQNSGPSDILMAASKMPTVGLEYLRLYRQAKFQEALYLLYSKLVELSRIDAVRKFGSVKFVDHAIPPERRSNMRLLPALLAGFIFFFLSVCTAFLYEYIHHIRRLEGESQRLQQLSYYLKPWVDLLFKVKRLFQFKMR
jgi:tyrosine-protein kinase Etk/Wzc